MRHPTTPRAKTSGARIIALLLKLQGGGKHSAAALAEALDISERTLYRDLKKLMEAHIGVRHDPAHGYWIAADSRLPPVDLSRDEIVSLVALSGAASKRGSALGAKASSAVRKLLSQLPTGLQDALNDQVVDLRLGAGEAGTSDLLPVLEAAASQGRQLRCVYQDADGKQVRMEFEPYRLLWAERAWYAIGARRKLETNGKPQGSVDVRNFRVSRFAEAEPTAVRFLVPEEWTLAGHLGNAWRLVRGEPCEVVLRFESGRFSTTVAATHWHPTQETHWLPDGRAELRFKVDGLDEIVWWVLGYGPKVEVVAPEALRHRAAELAREAGERHGK